MVPFVGWTSTGLKYAGIVVKYAGKAHDLKIIFKNGIATFGNSSNLRKVLGITDPLKEAHHLIPWQLRTHDLTQIAAHADDVPFHMNHPVNGIGIDKYSANLPDGVHANHPQYNNYVRQRMDELQADLELEFGGNIPPNEASQALRDLMDELREDILANPTTKINDLY